MAGFFGNPRRNVRRVHHHLGVSLGNGVGQVIEQSDIKLIVYLTHGHTMVSYVDETDRWWVCSCGSISQGELAFDVTSNE